MNFEYTLTSEDLVEGFRFWFGQIDPRREKLSTVMCVVVRMLGILGMTVAGLGLVGVALQLILNPINWQTLFFAAAFVAGMVFCNRLRKIQLGGIAVRQQAGADAARRILARTPSVVGPKLIRISSEGILVKNSTNQTQVAWNALGQVHVDDRFVTAKLGRAILVVPLRDSSSSQRLELEQKMRSAMSP